MRIAVIPTIRTFPWGAPGHCMGELVKALSQAGHEVLWLVAPIDLDHPEVKSLAARGVRVVALPEAPTRYVRFAKTRQRLRNWRQSSRPLAEIVDGFDPQHIFVNQGGTWCGLQDEFWNCLSQRAGLYSLICHLNQPQSPLEPRMLARASQLIAGSRKVYFASTWVQHLAEMQIASSIRQAARFQCPVRFDFADPLPWPTSSAMRLAMVSRLDAFHKGMDVALEALAELRVEGMDFVLTIYGSGADEEYLRRLAKFLAIDDRVVFAGYTSDLKALWSKEEILLLTSRFEGLAVSMLEAMGFGRPVIRTSYGGSEWIEDGVNGYVCPAAEPGLLRDTIRRAIAERSRWPEMGRRAHEKVQRDLDPNPAAVFLKALEP
jgi:glycosyltransferase involved in cell wall biosynthesis